MPKKFHIHEWISSIKYLLLMFIPYILISLIFISYILIGASIIQEIESNTFETSSSIKIYSRERFLSKILEKKQTYDLQQYTKYINKYIRQYEEEIRKQFNCEEDFSWNFSNSLFFIITTLTTIGSNELIPKNKLGKLFLIIYTGFGIPLTFVFLINLSYLIKYLINYITLIIYYFYSRKTSSTIQQHMKNILNLYEINFHHDNNLTIIQLILTFFIYIFIGIFFISSQSFYESFYLCFITLFTINLNIKIYQETNLFFIIIYLFIGLAILLLYVKTIKIIIENLLTNIGKKLIKNLVEFTQQLGIYDLTIDDLLIDNDINSNSISDSIVSRKRNLTRAISLEQPSTARPICIAEPLRRFSTGIMRALKNNDYNHQTLDKSVQVSTIIRRCGRCSESTVPILPVRQLSAFSTSSSSITDNSSSCDEDDIMDLPPPNLDRIRQRRATQVAKTIISQMATQPRSSSIDEYMPLLSFGNNRYQRSGDSSPVPVKCSVKVSVSTPPESSNKRQKNQVEFAEISKQISALLTRNDDEN